MDLTLYENGTGGDLILGSNDLEVTNAIFNSVYMSLFGGNVNIGHSDAEERQEGEQKFDYWQNDLYFTEEFSKLKLVSETENHLNHISLTSQGLYDLQETAKEDLEVLSDVSDVSVNVSINDVNNIKLIVKLQQKGNNEVDEYKFVWDSTKGELINEIVI